MSDQSQQEQKEVVQEQKEPVVQEPVVEQDPLEGFSDLEREMDQIVKARKDAKKAERNQAERAAKAQDKIADSAIADESSSQDSEGAEVGALDGALVPPTGASAPGETQRVVAGQEGQEGSSTPPVSGIPPSGGGQAADDEPFVYHYQDQDFDEQTIQNGLQLKAWADSLPPQAKEAINSLLTGTHILVDRAEYDRIQKGTGTPNAPTQTGTTQTSPETPSQTGVLTDEDLAELSPAVAQAIRNQQQQLSEVAEWRKQQEANQQQQNIQIQQQRIKTAVNTVTSEIQTKYALTADEWKKLEKVTEDSGYIVRGFQMHGDPERALREAFEWNYNTAFQQRELARQALANQTANTVVTEQQSKTKTRKANASALNPAGNSVPSGNSRKPTSPDEKRAARVADIAELLAGS